MPQYGGKAQDNHSLAIFLGLLFIALKWFDIIDWDWVWVTLPLWGLVVGAVIYLACTWDHH
ncbi:hypothetical protein OAA60_02550 [Porticoccaceae bacterium]|nr:hypothetical protein [Porticoccaceae bacterium]